MNSQSLFILVSSSQAITEGKFCATELNEENVALNSLSVATVAKSSRYRADASHLPALGHTVWLSTVDIR